MLVGLEPLAHKLLEKMSACNLSENDVFNKGRFVLNHREMAILGIRLARPDFEGMLPSTQTNYSLPLLESLNDRRISLLPKSALESSLKGMDNQLQRH